MTTAIADLEPRGKPLPPTGPAATALQLLGEKWTLSIIEQLVDGPMRFVALRRALTVDGASISNEQLRMRLAHMVDDGLLTKTPYRECPPRADYELTPAGLNTLPILRALEAWAADNTVTDGATVTVRS